jgi:hypothetical protein
MFVIDHHLIAIYINNELTSQDNTNNNDSNNILKDKEIEVFQTQNRKPIQKNPKE